LRLNGVCVMKTAWGMCLLLAGTASLHASEPSKIKHETIEFRSEDAVANVPERFRLAPHQFDVVIEPWLELEQSGVTVSKVRFPSPITSPHAINNTVHCEYYRPTRSNGKRPAVIVLDILDGRQIVSRGEAVWLAQHDIPALVVYMAYYGPRRTPGDKTRLLMPDIEHSTAAMRQTVLDCRRATAWLATQPGVDAERLGIVGTSLGSFLAGLTAASEPKLKSACLLLSGGGLVDAFYDHPKAEGFRIFHKFIGGTKAQLAKLIDPLDPLTYAPQLAHKKLLLIAASRDDVVPPTAAERLWNATGKPPIVWVDATHVGSAAYLFRAMNAVVRHLDP
jgi:dienelactone hydrolase